MPRRFAGDRLVIASHNPGKVDEIAALLAPYRDRDGRRRATLGLPEPEETGDSFEANAALKARLAAAASGLPALADDSGLVVPALGGAPGIYSARWAGPAKDFRIAMERVHRELGDRDRARIFVAVLALAWPGRRASRCSAAKSHGRLVWPPRGDQRLRLRPDVRARRAIPDLRRDGRRAGSTGSATAPAPSPSCVEACFSGH